MTVMHRAVIAALALARAPAPAQPAPAGGMVLLARSISPTTPIKIYDPAGSVRLVGWDRDSVVVTSASRPPGFFALVDRGGIKTGVDQFRFGVEEPRDGAAATPYDFVIQVPRQSQLAVKTASADIDGTDVSGWFYSASGTIRIRGATSTLDLESIDGSIDVNASASWVRARTGRGRLLVRGAVQDVDASTVGGALDVAAPSIMRGRFASVTGDIRYAAAPARGGIFEFSNHSGAVDMALPRDASAALELSSVTGAIENGFGEARPVSGGAHSMRLILGRGDAQVTVRTFKGTIRLRQAAP